MSILAAATFNAFAKQLSFALSPISLVFISELLTIFFILLTFGLFPTLKRIRSLKKSELLTLIAVGILNGVIGPYCFFLGLSMSTAVNASFIGQTESIFVMTLAYFFLRQKATIHQMRASASIIFGVLIIAMQGFTSSFSLQIGDVFLLMAVACLTTGYILMRRDLSHVEPHIPLFSRSVSAMAIFFLSSPFVDHPFAKELQQLTPSLFPVLLGFAFISRFFNSMMFYYAIERLNVVTVSLAGSFTIITSLCFTWFYLGEPLSWYHLVGGAFIVSGNIIAEITSLRRHSEKEIELHLQQRPHR